jgi:hypothetical protein
VELAVHRRIAPGHDEELLCRQIALPHPDLCRELPQWGDSGSVEHVRCQERVSRKRTGRQDSVRDVDSPRDVLPRRECQRGVAARPTSVGAINVDC